MLTIPRLLGGVLTVLLVSGVAGAQTATAPKETADIAALRKGAEQGRASDQWLLGYAYERGQGVPQDYAQAVSWYRKAAEQGHATAQYSLGAMYANWEGVPKDKVSAYMWFNLSAARATGENQKNAAATRDGTAKTMTPAQLAEA